MRSTGIAVYRPLFYRSSRLQKDILGDVAFSRDEGILKKGLVEFKKLLERVKKSCSKTPRFLERRIGQHSLYLWQTDPEKMWEGRNLL